MKQYYSATEVSNMLSISRETLKRKEMNGSLVPKIDPITQEKIYSLDQLKDFEEIKAMIDSKWDIEIQTTPKRQFTDIELFAGAGGLALGLEKAGFNHVALNEIMKDACDTLRANRPNWNIIEGDVANVSFEQYRGKVDMVSGGFPCQAFSYAGKKLGFEDTRGTLFYQFARVIKEVQPKIFLGENVRGLIEHNNGRTLSTIKDVISELGYYLIEPRFLRAIFYQVPQKRERLFLVGIRKDLVDKLKFEWPSPYWRIMTLKDALKAGDLYPVDVPDSIGQKYPKRKAEIMAHVPQGGYWRDLPIDLQKEYMKKSFYLGGGKTGMARRLSWEEPSLTLTCAPAQKQTERCHPEETRPLTTREYARIQTFPDDWQFIGKIDSIYKQIGNAVPVNLAYAMGRALIRMLNQL